MVNRPHILVFNPDQWRGDVLGHMGNLAAVTPNLDRVAREDGVSFRNAFVQNPVCTPSRCSFMTGWYPHVHGHRTMFHMLRARRGEPNLLRILRDNGYLVWWGGKNDLIPAQDGYERDCDIKFKPTPEDFKRWGRLHTKYGPPQCDWHTDPRSDTYYSFFAGRLDKGDDQVRWDGDWACVHGALDFIRNAPDNRPLCIYLPLTFPHPAYGVEEPWFSMIDRARLPPRRARPESWEDKPALLKGIWERQGLQNWTEGRWTELRATYYGMCARTDRQFGMILDALRNAGLYDRTAVFCFSDLRGGFHQSGS